MEDIQIKISKLDYKIAQTEKDIATEKQNIPFRNEYFISLNSQLAALNNQIAALKRQLAELYKEKKPSQQRYGINLTSALEKYRFKFPSTIESYFPKNGVGKLLLKKEKFINNILEVLRTRSCSSYYICGPCGSGKSILLILIAQLLVDRGESVYLITHAGMLQFISDEQLSALSESVDANKNIYLLIDEVHNNTTSHIWDYLLNQKETLKHRFITIGVGMTTLDGSPAFEVKSISSLHLTTEEIDYEPLIQYFRVLSNCDKSTRVFNIMKWILEYTGGHTYPFLRLCEYVFSNLGKLQSDTDIQNLVVGENFNKSECYRDISLRCFDSGCSIVRATDRILTKALNLDDNNILIQSGLWSEENNYFISNLFIYHHYYIRPHYVDINKVETNHNVILKTLVDPYALSDDERLKLMENILIYSLGQFGTEDFLESDMFGFRYENALTFKLGYTMSRLPSLYLAPQFQVLSNNKEHSNSDTCKGTAGSKPTIGLFLNGRLGIFLEVIRNGYNIKKHLDKFEELNYHSHKSDYIILDFCSEKLSNLPTVSTKYPQVLNKYYRFDRADNMLYRGNSVIRKNVSKLLPSSRKFCTLLKMILK